ncbi:sortase domain-containing protein [Nocardioides sp.]|uniref:sortase domain-containing protein n=1 Tax=Nocardioides sp. TaxID=35761 RepID=UPI003D14B94D
MAGSTLAMAAALLVAAGTFAACSESTTPTARSEPPASRTPSPSASVTAPPDRTAPAAAKPPFSVSDGRPRRASLSIPALGLTDLAVVPYRGRTDDARGTVIQDGGVAASPHGPQGGVGPGGLGNYQVTAHRTSSTRAFEMLPSLRIGQRVTVTAGGVRYVYEIRRTRETSFRSARSLAEQRAAVPGRPGLAPTRAFITLSTCATREDHAEGNFWSDEFKNPEHRIDKIGVLVQSR